MYLIISVRFGVDNPYPQANTITLPFFMAVNVVRYGGLVLRGQRRFIKPSTFAGAKDRNDLYQKFRLFET